MTDYINPEEPDWGVTQGFGAAPGGFNPVGGHTGRDKGTPVGRPLRAPGDGVITLAGNAGPWNTNDYWLEGAFAGNSVVLDCGPGQPAFTFNHLSTIVVTRGQSVRKGDVICYSGNTGGATSGPHHHFEVMPDGWDFNNGTYGRINPDHVCKGFYDGTQGQPTQPNHRKNGPQVTNQRADASIGSALVREIPAGQLEVFEGFVRGQEVTLNGFTSDVWFKDKIGYAWCGGFESQSTDGLTDLTPRKALAANQRLAGDGVVNQRKSASTGAEVVRQIPPKSVEVFTGFVRGQAVAVNGLTTDIWYVDAKGYAWAGGFESQDTVGLPDLTVVRPPTPAPAPIIPPVALPSAGSYLNGIDVAVYQESASLNTIASDFYIIKAGEGGGDWSDAALASNVAEARLTGKPLAFYHYARPLLTPENTAAAEAQSFLNVIKPYLRLGDVVALDWEAENQHRTDWALEWLRIVKDRTGATPLLYLNVATVNAHDWSTVEKEFPLWLSAPGTNAETAGFTPPAEKFPVEWVAGFLIHQYTFRGKLPGYAGDIDLNVFYGTAADWRALGATKLLQEPAPNPPIVTPAPPVTLDESDVLRRFFEWLIGMFINRDRK